MMKTAKSKSCSGVLEQSEDEVMKSAKAKSCAGVQQESEREVMKTKVKTCPGIANRAAMFEGNNSPSKAKDPALLTVAERKALFEKNKGEPPKPKKYPAPKPPVAAIASKVAALLEDKPTISQAQIEDGVKQERQKEMEQLLNRFNRNKEAEEDEEDASETTAMLAQEKSAKIVKPLAPPPMPPVPHQKPAPKRLSKLFNCFCCGKIERAFVFLKVVTVRKWRPFCKT